MHRNFLFNSQVVQYTTGISVDMNSSPSIDAIKLSRIIINSKDAPFNFIMQELSKIKIIGSELVK